MSDFPQHLHFSSSNTKDTGLRLIALHDAQTNFTVRTALANDKHQVPAIMAFAGARFSRSADTAESLFREINTSKTSAQEKLANIFVNYGHASVGDMANLFVYIEDVPQYLMMQFFYSSSLGGGQERSTRYQDFSQSQPPQASLYVRDKISAKALKTVEKDQRELFETLMQAYRELSAPVYEALTQVYQPEPGNKRQHGALQARAFDTIRAFLPVGINTSGAYITSAREWARLIQYFQSVPFPEYHTLATQLELLLNPPEEIQKSLRYLPEAPDLIRHTEADPRRSEMLAELQLATGSLAKKISTPLASLQPQPQTVRSLHQELTPVTTYLFFTLQILYPSLTIDQFGQWYQTLSEVKQKKLSQILFGRYTHHHHPPLYSQTGGYTFQLSMALSETRDLIRHRAWGRFVPLLETEVLEPLLQKGFQLPLYLEHPELAALRQQFVEKLEDYYLHLLSFSERLPDAISPRILLSVTPNAQQVDAYFTGGPKEISYMSQLRVRPGGHINYRDIAFQLAESASAIDPLLAALSLPAAQRPDPFSHEQFFDRG